MLAKNPILRGFHPDPSVIRVGDDFYLACSTFFWWPGVSLHHSRDLVHWEDLPSPLNRLSQLDLRGVSAAGGVWAPDLSYDSGTFYLVYTNVHSMYTWMYDTGNYLVTAPDIRGPWSEPVPLSRYGFDPSLFHDTDGRKYMISMATDHRIPKRSAGRLIIQEYSAEKKALVGEVHEVYRGDEIYLEGPHLYRHGDWYYILAADTGTGEGHGESILRSKNIFGPYEMYQADFMERKPGEAWSFMTSRHTPDLPIQKCGHCSLVDNGKGDWFVLHLCGRPSAARNPEDGSRFAGLCRYPLGRETAIQRVCWTDDGWLTLADGTQVPQMEVETGLAPHPFAAAPSASGLSISPYAPQDERHVSPTERPGRIRLIGREGITSRYDQTMLCRRWSEASFVFEALLDFQPENEKQLAGIVLLYDLDNWLYLHVTWDEKSSRCISLYRAENKKYECLCDAYPVPDKGDIRLRAAVKDYRAVFSYELCGTEGEIPVYGPIDVSFLSDEACTDGWFTGAVCGICCEDLTGGGKTADFYGIRYDDKTEEEE